MAVYRVFWLSENWVWQYTGCFDSHYRDPVHISGKHCVIYNRDENLVDTPMAHTWLKQELVCVYVRVCPKCCRLFKLRIQRESVYPQSSTLSRWRTFLDTGCYLALIQLEVDLRGALSQMGRWNYMTNCSTAWSEYISWIKPALVQYNHQVWYRINSTLLVKFCECGHELWFWPAER